ncbi:hypothetical protein HZB94_00535 [Candidatus Falkowbacteria bacterium]|nr:hypothetical protein [Candidatus Falkowbacteria bacterium]
MLDFLNENYKKILAGAALVVAYWVGLILYRVYRGEIIQKVDWWKSKWKIVLFWIVIALLALLVIYSLDKFGLLEQVVEKIKE